MAAADAVTTSQIALVESRAALGRMRAGGRLSASAHRMRLRDFTTFWTRTAAAAVDEETTERAAHLAERHRLSAYDAVHLASALTVAAVEPMTFACFDAELRAAAAAERLTLAPAA